MRMDDYVGPFVDLECGLPQVAPSSPVLFLLYTQPIYDPNQYGDR